MISLLPLLFLLFALCSNLFAQDQATTVVPPPEPVIPVAPPTPTPPPPAPAPAPAPTVDVPFTPLPLPSQTSTSVVPAPTSGPGTTSVLPPPSVALPPSGPANGAGNVSLELPKQAAPVPAAESKEDPRDKETISVDFPDEDIRTIIRNVADLYGLNVVMPDTLVGRTSIKLSDVTWRQVFKVVLEPVNFGFVEEGNIIKIKTISQIEQEPSSPKVFLINWARAKDLIVPISSLFAGLRIQADERTNALIIVARNSQFKEIEYLIRELDRRTPQVLIESRFIEINDGDIKRRGVDYPSLGESGYRMNAGPFNRNYSQSSNATTSNTNSNTVGNSTTVTTGNNFSQSTNLSTGALSGSSGFDNSVTNSNTNAVDTVASLTNATSVGRVDTAVFSADQFSVVLRFLDSLSDSKLIANPTVVTLDNQPIYIHIGQDNPVVQPSINNQTGLTSVGSVRNVETGIKLWVTPQVTNGGFINLAVNPEVSRIQEYQNFFGGQYPVVATRKIRNRPGDSSAASATSTPAAGGAADVPGAKLLLKDGYTLAIGGLSEDNSINGKTKVPILGDIPLIGLLFQNNRNQQEKRNLLIFITAKTLDADKDTYRDIVDPRMLHTMGITPDQLPGYHQKGAEIPGVKRMSETERRSYELIEEERTAVADQKRLAQLQAEVETLKKVQEEAAKDRAENDASTSTAPARRSRR